MNNLSLKNKKLEIVVFIGGASVMILELIGARILAPFLGTSIFVWSSLIGIILGALSLGYYLGGRLSEKNPSFEVLTKIILLAGLSIIVIPIIKYPILILSTLVGVKLGSVIATLLLFSLPSVILGTISPYTIRLKIKDVESSGGVVGNLYALSTIGSITGTFLAGFFLIPTFGSEQIIYGLSFLLILTSILSKKKILGVSLLFTTVVIWLVANAVPSVYLYEADSAYNHIRVVDYKLDDLDDQRGVRGLYMATELHSIIYKDSDEIISPYHKLHALDNLFKSDITKALTIGGGAYVAPVSFLKRYPKATMTVVEIDPAVTKVAKDFFQLTDDDRIKIYHEDGRIFLNNNQEKFDVIYGDAYSSYYSIPFHLTTIEAFQKIYNSLTDDGILVLNMISALEGEKALFFNSEYKTINQVFDQVYVFPAHFYDGLNTNHLQNIIIIATKNKTRLSIEDLQKNADENQQKLLQQLWTKPIESGTEVRVLTDNFAPVDFYISKLL